ncbi:MAG: hypothetical protein R2912_11370 [Eubacteriales bacterium]
MTGLRLTSSTACGVVTPLLSSLFTGMPMVAVSAWAILCELAVYGVGRALLMQAIRTGKNLGPTSTFR